MISWLVYRSGTYMDWILLIAFLIIGGIWSKWLNTQYMRKLTAAIKAKAEQEKVPPPVYHVGVDPAKDDTDDYLGVAEFGVEILGDDNKPTGGPSV